MSDLISRQAAIDALKNRWKKTRNYEGIGDDIAEECELYLKQVPSAQPSVSKEEMVGDTISRQAAIKAICEDGTMLERQGQYSMTMVDRKYRDIEILEALPSAQPGCEDAVSRTAAIDALPYLLDYEGFKGESGYVSKNLVRTMLKGLPSVTPKQPGWIPWDSGRFPEESGTYTVTVYDGAKRRVTYAKYQKRLKRWELTGARAYWRVLAWMEKPKPWEGGQDGEG